KAAETAEEKAQEALDKANEDSNITPEEKAAIEKANEDVKKAKEKAAEAVDDLPASDVKDSLKDRVDEVNPVETPKTDAEKAAEELV
ncbi:GA-like domain-containing protein, partial [Gallibacterium anatis]